MAAAKTPPAAPAPKAAPAPAPVASAQPAAKPQVQYVQVPQEPAGPPPPDPMKETNERQRKAIEKFQHQRAVGEVRSTEVAAERPPKAATPATSEATPTAPAAGAGDTSAPASAEATERKAPQPRYDSDSFKAWARNNPDKAAEVLGLSKADANAYIKLQNRERKFYEEQSTKQAELEAARKATEDGHKSIQKLIDEQNATVQPVMDLVSIGQASAKSIKSALEAASGNFQAADFSGVDFGATDDLFEHVHGISFDDYARARARQGLKVSPQDRALRLENERLRKQLAAKPTEQAAAAPIEQAPATPAAAATKASDLAWVASTLADDHPARELRDWDKRILAALGTDESMTLEDAADQVLEESRAKLAPAPATPARRPPAARPPTTPPKRQRHTAESDLAQLQKPRQAEAVDDEGPDPIKDPDGRTRWALQRHMQRMAQR